MKQIIGVQYLRAVAALMVVVLHIANFFPIFGEDFRIGRFGVDLFFVISGFVMWITARQMTPGQFIARRIIRIVPIYWLVTIALSFYTLAGGLQIGFVTPWGDLWRSLLFIPFKNDMVRGYVMPVVEVGWTLNLEMLFYLLFALSLFFRSGLRMVLMGLALTGIVLLASLAGGPETPLGFYGDSIVFEFLAGMGLGWLYLSGKIRPSAVVLPVALVIFVPTLVAWPGLTGVRAIDLGVAASVIVYATIAFEPWFRRAPSRFLLLLGDASYSIYLTHKTPLEFFLAANRKGLFPSTWLLAWPIAMICCILLGVVVFRLLERPITLALLARFDRRRDRTPQAAGPGISASPVDR